MSKFKLEIEMGNDAMQDADDLAGKIEYVAVRVRAGYTTGKVFDANGNSVGHWVLK
jgi:hypothetical protein